MRAVKTVGSSGQIALGKQYAGRPVLIEQIEPGVWVIKLGRFVPDNERWLQAPEVASQLDAGLTWAAENPPSATDLDQLEDTLRHAPRPDAVELDLNNPVFQQALFALPKDEQRGVLGTLKKLSRMNWEQVYRDKGLRWEAILSREGPDGRRLYTLRISRGCRAVALRDGRWLRFVSLHPDHDSAYRP